MKLQEKQLVLKNSIDVYLNEIENEKILITFHRITTRDRIEIITNKLVANFLSLLDGTKTIYEITQILRINELHEQINSLVRFLYDNSLVVDSNNDQSMPRYERQIAYFDDMFLDISGINSQKILEAKHIVFLGCGAFSAGLAELLVRTGVSSITLVDYKQIEEASLDRHLFARPYDIGSYKVDALSQNLRRVNKNIKVMAYNVKILPHTDLSKFIPVSTDMVINGLDEPYIGHTSLKVGRFCQALQIPMYVMGGFDAHLMSSGELIIPPKTPCIDCVQQTFQISLKDWKPTYFSIQDSQSNRDLPVKTDKANKIGWAGGIAGMSAFSSYFSSFSILNFLISGAVEDKTARYEYLLNEGVLTKFEVKHQLGCEVCCG